MHYLEEITKADQDVNPLFTMLGIAVEHLGKDMVELVLPYKHDLLQGAGVVAGGVLTTLMDEAMAHAVLMHLESDQRTATVDLSTQFFAPAKAGNDVNATARVVRRGKRIIFAEAQAFSNGTLVAKTSASFVVNGK